MVDVEKQAVLAAQAVALRRKLTESHLAKFRTEAKNRCAECIDCSCIVLTDRANDMSHLAKFRTEAKNRCPESMDCSCIVLTDRAK